MSDLEVYRTMQDLKKEPKEYDIEDQLTFDDLLEELEDRNTF